MKLFITLLFIVLTNNIYAWGALAGDPDAWHKGKKRGYDSIQADREHAIRLKEYEIRMEQLRRQQQEMRKQEQINQQQIDAPWLLYSPSTHSLFVNGYVFKAENRDSAIASQKFFSNHYGNRNSKLYQLREQGIRDWVDIGVGGYIDYISKVKNSQH